MGEFNEKSRKLLRSEQIKRILMREMAFFLVHESECPEKVEIRITYPASMAILRIEGKKFEKIFREEKEDGADS